MKFLLEPWPWYVAGPASAVAGTWLYAVLQTGFPTRYCGQQGNGRLPTMTLRSVGLGLAVVAVSAFTIQRGVGLLLVGRTKGPCAAKKAVAVGESVTQ